MKKKRKGISAPETVIIIAVIAVLVAAAIPTVLIIGRHANLSADAQAVHDMNIALSASLAEGSSPGSPAELIELLAKKGFTEFRPRTDFHTFYWLRDKNTIVLANEDDNPVYPEAYSGTVFSLEGWFDLEESAGMSPAPTAPVGGETLSDPDIFAVTIYKSGSSSRIDFGIPSTATEGQPYHAEILIPEEMRASHSIVKVTATMPDGENEHKFVVRSPNSTETFDSLFLSNEPAVLDIPCVTGPITVHVSVKEFCTVTITGDENMLKETVAIRCEKGGMLYFSNQLFEDYLLKDGYRLASATATMNGRDLGDIYDESNHRIYSKSNIISDVDIRITTEWKAYSVKLIIINNESEIAVDERITSHLDDSCSFDLNAILGTDKFKVVRQYHYPTNIKDKYMPTIVYNDESRTLRITDLKCDLTFYYLVEYTD